MKHCCKCDVPYGRENGWVVTTFYAKMNSDNLPPVIREDFYCPKCAWRAPRNEA